MKNSVLRIKTLEIVCEWEFLTQWECMIKELKKLKNCLRILFLILRRMLWEQKYFLQVFTRKPIFFSSCFYEEGFLETDEFFAGGLPFLRLNVSDINTWTDILKWETEYLTYKVSEQKKTDTNIWESKKRKQYWRLNRESIM